MKEPSVMRRGWMVLAVMVALSLMAALFAYDRNHDTRRLSVCVSDVITTINERAAFTSRLDNLDAEDRAATRAFWTDVAKAGQDRPKARAVFDRYRAMTTDIERRRVEVLKVRDSHKFPTLADCEVPE